MLTGKTLLNYARLVVKIGVNLQKGQGLEIACPVEKPEVARALTKAAYEMVQKSLECVGIVKVLINSIILTLKQTT